MNVKIPPATTLLAREVWYRRELAGRVPRAIHASGRPPGEFGLSRYHPMGKGTLRNMFLTLTQFILEKVEI